MSEEQGTKDREEERRKRIFASESAHWYHHDASSCHQVLKAKKKKGDPDEWRPTNISDARKMNLLPSVTNLIGKYSNKAGIEIWKRAILLDSITSSLAFELYEARENDDETRLEAIFKKIAEAAEKETGKYAELGTLVHACIEKGIKRIADGYDIGTILVMVNEMVRDTGYEESAGAITGVIHTLFESNIVFKGCKLVQEKGFAFNILLSDNTEFGLAGKIDMLIEYSPDQIRLGLLPNQPAFTSFRHIARGRAEKGLPARLLLDFKTRKPNRLKNGGVTFPSYTSDAAQLAGYSEGAKFAAGFKPDACFNVLIASDSIRDAKLSNVIEFREYVASEIHFAMNILKSMAMMWMSEERFNYADPYTPHLNESI
jgi:hypothetical protein